jgi:hypothetical protein
MRGRTGIVKYLGVLILVLVPTMINETKGTLFLLPVALFSTFLAASRPATRFRHAAVGAAVITMALGTFVLIYDHFGTQRWGYGIVDFLTSEEKVEYYLHKDAELGSDKAGRIDALVIPLKELAKEPSELVFGLGVGNATESALGPQFTGQYFARFSLFLLTAATTLLLEIGVLGLAIVLLVQWLILQDARVVARNGKDVRSTLALGWIAVSLVMMVALFYKGIMASNPLSYLFWYLSGLVAAERMVRASTHKKAPGIESDIGQVTNRRSGVVGAADVATSAAQSAPNSLGQHFRANSRWDGQ